MILPATAWPEKDGTVTNTDRMVQLGRKALEAPGEAKEDLWIIQEIARRMGLDWNYAGPRDVFNEMRKGMNSIAGITWERLEAESCVTYPCEKEGDPGQPVVFVDKFPTPTGRAKFVPGRHHPRRRAARPRVPVRAHHRAPARALAYRRDDAPRQRCSTRSSPSRWRPLHPLDLDAIGAKPGDVITVESRRGIISLYARADDGTPRGAVFIPFCFYEAAANLLTNPGARSVRQDSGVQVLRGEGDARRRADAALELRRRPGARGT